jgi:hypothetical protein
MATIKRITLIGIRPAESSIGPAGIHLRWSFPAEFGFPAKGFAVYRRPSGGFKSVHCLNLTKEKVPTNSVIAPGATLEGVSFHYPDTVQIRGASTDLAVQPPGPQFLELRFAQPTAHVRITVSDTTGTVALRAYAGGDLVATSVAVTTVSGIMEVVAPNITRVTLPLRFRTLSAICYLTMDDACQDKSWGQPIAELPLLMSVNDGLARLEDKLRNRYAIDSAHAVQRYGPGLKPLIDWLVLLQDPTSYADPTILPSELQLPSPDPNSPLKSIRPQSMLLLAALDPNIARFLSLYWVDQYDANNGAKLGSSYDYKVTGAWEKREAGCGMIFGLGAKEPELPVCAEPLEGNQLPGLRWSGRDPLGRVGLRWPRPKDGQGAVQPVLFDLWRDSGADRTELLTDKRPVLVPSDAWAHDSTAQFVDTNVPLGRHRYQLRAIDLFGQISEVIESEPIAVEDLEAPPPPVRLYAVLTQPGYPWRQPEQLARVKEPAALRLQFEYGDAQHRQAPDAKTFHVYWRAESMFVSRSVALQPVSSDARGGGGTRAYTVRASDGAGLDLSAFVGGKLSRERTTGIPFPAAERHHYQVARGLSSKEVLLAPSESQFVKDQYRLISDPRLRSNWTKLDLSVPVRQPLQGIVRAVEPFHATAASVRTVTPRLDSLAMLPPGRRPATLAEAPPIVEVELDRRLLEPDLLADGTVDAGGQTYPILYSTSDAEAPARIGLPADANVSTGATLVMRSASSSAAARLVKSLTIQGSIRNEGAKVKGGEIAFSDVRNGETVTYVARVVSDIEYAPGVFHVVVRLSSAASDALQPGTTRSLYYAPYQLELNAAFPATAAGPTAARTTALPLPAGTGSQNAYFALTTQDDRYKEGPLSSPAQVVAVKPPPTGVPGRPFPCGQSAAAAAGYATPPNRRGRAMVCLAWDLGDMAPADGLRYELARTSDATILATHRRNWLQGRADVLTPLVAGQTRAGRVSAVYAGAARGLYRVSLNVSLAGVAADAFAGGRLAQLPQDPATPDTRRLYFQVARIHESNAGALDVVLRTAGQVPPVAGPCTIEATPDYEAAKGDNAVLGRMAEENPDAFGVVTGVPIATMRFTDEIAGIGGNRFFYRVRAVDTAENRSAWSLVSAPFYQVDTTPPEAPRIAAAIGGQRQATISWLAEPGTEVTEYRLYRATAPDLLSGPNLHQASPRRLFISPGEDQTPLRLSPLTKQFGAVSLDVAPPISADALAGGTAPPRISAVYRVADAGIPDKSMNFLVQEITRVQGREVLGLNPILPDRTEVVLILDEPDGSPIVLHEIEHLPITVIDQKVDFSFPYTVSQILGVFLASEVDYSAIPPTNQSAQNFFTSSSAYDPTQHRITHLAPRLETGAVVAVLWIASLRGGPTVSSFLLRNPFSGQLLSVEHGELALDIEIARPELRAIYRADEYRSQLQVDRQNVFDYLLRRPTRYNPVIRALVDLNPILPDGTEVMVEYEDGSGPQHLLSAKAGEWCYHDRDLAGLLPGASYCYRLVAVKQTRCGPGPNDYIEIVSPPSVLVTVPVFDDTPPEPPEWLGLEWFLEEGDLPVAQLRWASADVTLTCTLQRRSIDGVWLAVSPPLLSLPSGEWRFIDRTADPSITYEYRVRCKNRLGILNGHYAVQNLSAFGH